MKFFSAASLGETPEKFQPNEAVCDTKLAMEAPPVEPQLNEVMSVDPRSRDTPLSQPDENSIILPALENKKEAISKQRSMAIEYV